MDQIAAAEPVLQMPVCANGRIGAPRAEGYPVDVEQKLLIQLALARLRRLWDDEMETLHKSDVFKAIFKKAGFDYPY